jgi:hypothetical protein
MNKTKSTYSPQLSHSNSLSPNKLSNEKISNEKLSNEKLSNKKIYFVYGQVTTDYKINITNSKLIRAMYSDIDSANEYALKWHAIQEPNISRDTISIIVEHTEGENIKMDNNDAIKKILVKTCINRIMSKPPIVISKSEWKVYVSNGRCRDRCVIS